MRNQKISKVQEAFQKCLLVAYLFFTSTYGSTIECCQSEIGWKSYSHYCNDGSKVNLNCSNTYLVHHDGDEYFYVDNSSSLIVVVYETNISSEYAAGGEFCQANVNDELNFLVCFPDASADSDIPPPLNIFFGLCSVLSSIFLALTLVVYLILPSLRELQDKAIMSLCVSFMVAFFILGIQSLDFLDLLSGESTCIFTGFLAYYSFLGAFFWLNIISFNIWKSLWFLHLNVRSSILFTAYSIFGWGIPFCFLVFALVIHSIDNTFIKPGFGEDTCWFNGNSAKWMYFYGPVSVLLTMNLIYLGLTGWKLWYQYGNLNSSNVEVLRVKCLMYVQLSLMMGATWMFEIISFAFRQSNPFYWIIPDTVNALQGVFIFCLFVIWRAKVKKLLALRRPCSLPFPKKWASCKDQEEWDENDVNNIQLTNTLL